MYYLIGAANDHSGPLKPEFEGLFLRALDWEPVIYRITACVCGFTADFQSRDSVRDLQEGTLLVRRGCIGRIRYIEGIQGLDMDYLR